jgi:hypothetical protein
MSKRMRIFGFFAIFLLISVLSLSPFILRKSEAASLGNTYLFLERMQVNTTTDMILLVTPSSNFDSGSTLTIAFPHDNGEWCRVDYSVNLTAAGTASSALDLGGDWDIDAALPDGGSGLSVTCYQGDDGGGLYDRLVVTGLGALTGGTSYGLEITGHADFQTVNSAGQHLVTVQITEGSDIESISFEINLVTGDQVTVTASVAEAETITCTINSSSVPLGTLYRGGAYTTAGHTINTVTSEGIGGFYWAVYGEGDGTGTDAGLATTDSGGDILPSTGSTTINLLTASEGFGLIVTSADGTVTDDFQDTTPGIFGALNRTFDGARVILYGAADSVGFDSTITLGAKAAGDSVIGSYEETLTYVCGGYIGTGDIVTP